MERYFKIYNVFGIVKMIGGLISGLAIFGMMLFISVDVVSRNFLGGSISGGFEIVENYFMPLAIFPGLGIVYASGILPKMDLLFVKLSEKAKSVVIYILVIIEIIIFALVVYYTLGYALEGFARKTSFSAGGNMLPIYPFLFLVPIGFALVFIENVFILIKNIISDKVTLLVKED